MNPPLDLSLQWIDWGRLFVQFLSLSLLAVGGAITTVPEMHRYLVEQQRWLTEIQFNTSIVVAQIAPGPNILFVALIGWQVGLNSGSIAAGLLGTFVTLFGILLPSTTLTYLAARWAHANRTRRSVRAFTQGMAPIVIALFLATGWILVSSDNSPRDDWRIWLIALVSALVIGLTRLHPVWMLLTGALLGWYGLI